MSKNLKKLAALSMSIIVLVTMSLSAMAMPNYTFDTTESDNGLMPVKEVIFSEDFAIPESGDLAEPKSIWGAGKGSQTVTVLKKTSNAKAGKGYLWLDVVGTKGTYYKTQMENALTGKYTIEFKFNKTADHTSKDGKTTDIMFFGAGYTDGSNDNLAIKLGIGADDRPYYVSADGTTKVPFITDKKAWTKGWNLYKNWTWDEGDWSGKSYGAVTAELGTNTASWYTVKVDVNTQAGTYDVYLNGALCVEDAAFISAIGIDWATTGINFPYAMEADSAVGVRYVYDDLCIYKDYEGVTNLYAEDFNEYAEAKSWSSNASSSGNITNYTGIAGLGISHVPGKSGTITATGNQLVATYNSGASGAIANGLMADDNVTIDLDFTVSGVPESASDSWVPVIGITGAGAGGGFVLKVDESGRLGYQWYNETDAAVSSLGTVTLNEKHDLTLHVDFTTGKYTLYVDGNLILCKESLSKNTTQAANIVNGEGYAIVLGHKDTPTATVAYDNIRVYKDAREEVMEEIPAELSKIFTNTSFVLNKVELPTAITGFDGYKISWSVAENDYIKIATDRNIATVKQDANTHYLTLNATVKDANGEYAASRNFKVKVVAGANNIIDDNGAGTITATGRQTPAGSILFLAVYDSTGALVGIVPAETISNNTITATYDYSNLAAGTYSAKAMLFNGRTTLVPYCSPSRTINIVVK